MWPIYYPEMSHTAHNIPEEWRPLLNHGRSQKSCNILPKPPKHSANYMHLWFNIPYPCILPIKSIYAFHMIYGISSFLNIINLLASLTLILSVKVGAYFMLSFRWFTNSWIHLTLILLTWRIWWASNNASRWQKGFNLAFKGLIWWCNA